MHGSGVPRWSWCHLHRNREIVGAWEWGAEVATVPSVWEWVGVVGTVPFAQE